jgi:hypothetical protein
MRYDVKNTGRGEKFFALLPTFLRETDEDYKLE